MSSPTRKASTSSSIAGGGNVAAGGTPLGPMAGDARGARGPTRTSRPTRGAGPSPACRKKTCTLTRAASAATLVGMTLTELLVAIALLSTTLAATLTALEQGQRAYALGAARVEAQQNGRIVLERLAREIRNGGAGGVGFDAISVAERERVVLHEIGRASCRERV